jgi:hypothetical protein
MRTYIPNIHSKEAIQMAIIQKNSFITLFFALILFLSIYTVLTHSNSESQVSFIEIEEGDTLWSLAESFSGEIPHHDWIDEIMKVNDLPSTTIIAGTSIQIPNDHLKYAPDTTRIYAGDGE